VAASAATSPAAPERVANVERAHISYSGAAPARSVGFGAVTAFSALLGPHLALSRTRGVAS